MTHKAIFAVLAAVVASETWAWGVPLPTFTIPREYRVTRYVEIVNNTELPIAIQLEIGYQGVEPPGVERIITQDPCRIAPRQTAEVRISPGEVREVIFPAPQVETVAIEIFARLRALPGQN